MTRRCCYFPCVLACLGVAADAAQADVKFNRDVLPILSTKCYPCHGTDEAQRQAGLRLDLREQAIAFRDGRRAIAPGKPAESELMRRVHAKDPNQVMPPSDAGGTLNAKERGLLRRWIATGATYEGHWAFSTPRRPSLPTTTVWTRKAIDTFIARRLKQVDLTPNRRAAAGEWLRRVSFDLTGLPPTIDELEGLLASHSPDAYDRMVDRLLASHRYGERMATWWLDGARYGDSHGYDNDLENSQWPWRNWVIDAFNRDQPFDQFTIEQLAGDLLPNATERQVLATAFSRNHRIQTEDGAIDEEWRTEYVIDRVETMGAVWMGLTIGCARCHDHKYDPLSQKEFYQLFSLFNNLDEKGFINNLRGSAEPRARYQAEAYTRELAAIKRRAQDGAKRKQALAALETRHPLVMIMREMATPRKAHVLVRGQYSARGESVAPGLPTAVGPQLEQADRVTRLTLARWLVSGDHPLTGRVLANRLWEQLFGAGIVATSENFGVQSEWPSHPGLLEWLAVELVESGWQLKRAVREMVLSAAYRQHHGADAARRSRDPKNRLLSRGPRVRLTAEMVRDQALCVSGLMCEQLGGPSVRPYQPAGFWKEVEKRGTYKRSSGADLYRRSLYTAVRRTVLAPGMALFDMPSREICTVKRPRTNTPLQALALLNEVTYVEAAKHLAAWMWTQGTDPAQRINAGFRRLTQRAPSAEETRILLHGYERRVATFEASSTRADALLRQGQAAVKSSNAPSALAALTTVASILLNLDEAINK